MTNISVVIGRLTKDPVIKLTKSESKVINFTVACTKSYLKNENNEADFIQCSAWNKLAERLESFTKRVLWFVSWDTSKVTVLQTIKE